MPKGNNMRQIEVNRHDATSLYLTLFDKMISGQVYPIPAATANQVSPAANVNFFNLTTTQLPAGRIGIFGGTFATLPKNNNIVMANLPGVVGTGSTNTVVDGFGNVINMIPLFDSTTNEPFELPDNYPTAALQGRQVYGLLQAASGVANDTAVAVVANCQMSFVVFDAANVLTLVTPRPTGAAAITLEFGTNQFRDNLHVPILVKHGGKQIDDALTGGNIEYIERTFEVTTAITVGSKLNINTGAVTGTGATTVTTVNDGGLTISNLNIQTSGANFEGTPSLVALDNGIHMKKGTAPLSGSEEIVWESSTEVSFYRQMDIGDFVKIRIPYKNNQ